MNKKYFFMVLFFSFYNIIFSSAAPSECSTFKDDKCNYTPPTHEFYNDRELSIHLETLLKRLSIPPQSMIACISLISRPTSNSTQNTHKSDSHHTHALMNNK